jgi:hypothetical protein
MICQYHSRKSREVEYSQTACYVGSVEYIRIHYRHLAVSSTKMALLQYNLFLCQTVYIRRIHSGSQLINGRVNPLFSRNPTADHRAIQTKRIQSVSTACFPKIILNICFQLRLHILNRRVLPDITFNIL